MPYSAEISRTNPTCLLFLIDQSGSMAGPFGGQPGKSKAEGVADAINRLLQNLVLKCAKSEGIRDYFHVGVIGYGAKAAPAFGGALAGRGLVPISLLANNPLRVESRTRKIDDGAGGILEQNFKFPVWFEPTAKGKSPMCQALTLTRQSVGKFLKDHPDSYPPMVIHLTDGEATDGDPSLIGGAVQEMASSDGSVLLFNAHLSSKPAPSVLFPDNDDDLPDDFAKMLFELSSKLPARLQQAARGDGLDVNANSRGFVFNADLISVIRFLDIGTRVATSVR